MSTIVIAVPMLSMLALATSTDFVDRRIPNGLSLGGAVVGFAVHAYLFGLTGLGLSLLGWAVCLAFFMPLYLGHGTAAGDVKLMGMVGAFLGPIDGFIACIFTLIAGAALATLALTWGGIARRLAGSLRLTASVDGVDDRAAAIPPALEKIPYAAAIAIGATIVVLRPDWLAAALPSQVLQ